MPIGIKPEWANLPRKRCKNCPVIFKPKRPEQEFCSPNCRKEFDKHGGTFSKLKPVIEKEIARRVKERNPLDHEWQHKIEIELAGLRDFKRQVSEILNLNRRIA